MAVPARSEPYRPGVIIAGKYRLAERLGAGAMGTVWSAVNQDTLGRVALKLIERPEAELRRRLLREARACASIQHKNVVQVFDVGQTDEQDPFLILELLRGETLATLLARRRRLGEAEAAAIARDAARGLSAVHAQGIVHRDLKPANIFLHVQAGEETPVVKLLDFGVSKSLVTADGPRTAIGSAIGSPVYMSPEQACGRGDVDFRADLWSLGVVLYEMLTGERPIGGEPAEVLFKIAHTSLPRVSQRVRRVSPELDDLVAGCLTRDRALRPASAAEIGASLEAYVASSSAGARGSLPSLTEVEPETRAGEAPPGTASGTRPRHGWGPRGEGSRSARTSPPSPPAAWEGPSAVTVRLERGSGAPEVRSTDALDGAAPWSTGAGVGSGASSSLGGDRLSASTVGASPSGSTVGASLSGGTVGASLSGGAVGASLSGGAVGASLSGGAVGASLSGGTVGAGPSAGSATDRADSVYPPATGHDLAGAPGEPPMPWMFPVGTADRGAEMSSLFEAPPQGAPEGGALSADPTGTMSVEGLNEPIPAELSLFGALPASGVESGAPLDLSVGMRPVEGAAGGSQISCFGAPPAERPDPGRAGAQPGGDPFAAPDRGGPWSTWRVVGIGLTMLVSSALAVGVVLSLRHPPAPPGEADPGAPPVSGLPGGLSRPAAALSALAPEQAISAPGVAASSGAPGPGEGNSSMRTIPENEEVAADPVAAPAGVGAPTGSGATEGAPRGGGGAPSPSGVTVGATKRAGDAARAGVPAGAAPPNKGNTGVPAVTRRVTGGPPPGQTATGGANRPPAGGANRPPAGAAAVRGKKGKCERKPFPIGCAR